MRILKRDSVKISNLKLFLSIVMAIFLLVILGIPIFLYRSYKNRNLFSVFLYDIAIALDELGGTLIYGVKDKTISYMTGLYVINGEFKAIILARIIDFLFGKNHCINIYYEESGRKKKEDNWG